MMNFKNSFLYLLTIFIGLFLSTFIFGLASDNPVTVTGKVMNWKTGELISNANVTVEIKSNDKLLSSNSTSTNSSGEYILQLSNSLTKGKYYTVNVTAEKNGNLSYVRRKFKWEG